MKCKHDAFSSHKQKSKVCLVYLEVNCVKRDAFDVFTHLKNMKMEELRYC